MRVLTPSRAIGWVLVAATLVISACSPARAVEHVILYFSREASVRQVFAQDRPELHAVISDGAVAVMTIGPADIDPLATIRLGRYVRRDQPVDDIGFEPGVIPIFEPLGPPAAGDALLREARRHYPGAPVIALHAAPMVPPGSHGIADALTVPSWIAISSMYGRLYSETTRRAGVVSNLDVAPTLSRMLHGKTPTVTPGAPMWGEPPGAKALRHGLPFPVASTMELQDGLLSTARGTNPVNFSIAFLGVIVLFVGAYVLIRHKSREARWVQTLLVAALIAPLAAGMAASRLAPSMVAFLALSVAFTVGLTAVCMALGRALAFAGGDAVQAALLLATGGTSAWLISATWRGAIGIAVSPITNLYLTGIRFYGLGNEYAAILIGCGIVAGLLIVERARARVMTASALTVLGVWFVVVCYVIGWPMAGANMGGLVTGLIACGIAWYLAARRSMLRAPWLWPLLATVILVSLVVWTDAHSAHATHIGRFVQATAAHSTTPLAMLGSKADIQWRLLTAPPAYAVYLAAVIFLWLIRGPLAPARRRVFRQRPWAAIAIPSLLIGGAFGMLLNDTGIVMWGLMAGIAIAAGAILALEPPVLAMMNE